MFDSTKELRQLIIDNPDLPLAVFANEEANNGEYYSMSTEVLHCSIREIALYESRYKALWLDKEEYRDALVDELSDEDDYVKLSDEEFDNVIDDKLSAVEFTKCIYVCVGN